MAEEETLLVLKECNDDEVRHPYGRLQPTKSGYTVVGLSVHSMALSLLTVRCVVTALQATAHATVYCAVQAVACKRLRTECALLKHVRRRAYSLPRPLPLHAVIVQMLKLQYCA